MATQQYRLTCLSPVHIGTGQEWTRFDGAYENKMWYVVDLDAVFARGVGGDELAQAMSAADFTWAEWLSGRKMRAQDVALYSLPCPIAPKDVAIREGIKDPYLKPYIPGTTLKGAIRTAIIWHLLKHDQQARTFAADYLLLVGGARDILDEVQRLAKGNREIEFNPSTHLKAIRQALDLDDADAQELLSVVYRTLGKDLQEAKLGNRREQIGARDLRSLDKDAQFLALPVERFLLGKDPNHDLMRTLHVLDTQPVSLEQMEVELVWTYTIRQNRLVEKREDDGEYKNLAECIKPDTHLQVRIDRDDYLLRRAANQLHFASTGVDAILKLPEICNRYAQSLIEHEMQFYTRYQLNPMLQFYDSLKQRLVSLPAGAFLLNIGWGGGWEAKTVGDILREEMDDEEFRDLRRKYQLGKNPKSRQIDWNSPFPKTRLVAYQNGGLRSALGWVLLEPANAP